MFRRKQDADRHVSSILVKIKDEREIPWGSVPRQVYQLLGQIEEALGNKESAVEAYKRNQRSPAPKMKLFDDGSNFDLPPHDVQTLLKEARFDHQSLP